MNQRNLRDPHLFSNRPLKRLVSCVLGSWLGLQTLPANALDNRTVNALVEAFRQATVQGVGFQSGVFYSDWQLSPEDIGQWSETCLGRRLTATQFATSPQTARGVITCIVRQQLDAASRTSGSNNALAVRQTVAWWLTRDLARHNDASINPYTDRVVRLYEQQLVVTPQPETTSPVATSPAASPTPVANPTPADRKSVV